MKNERIPRVVAITSGKGGVGKTSFTLSLSRALRDEGKKVILFDADLSLGNVHVFLGLNPEYSILHVIKEGRSLKDIMIEVESGLTIIPAASGIEELSNLRPEEKIRLLEELEGLPEIPDFFIIDTAAGISSNVSYFATGAHEIVVLVTPEPTSIVNAYSLIKILHEAYAEKSIWIAVNMAKTKREGKETFSKISSACERFLGLSIRFMGVIPFDPIVRDSEQKRVLPKELNRESPYVKSVQKLANRLISAEHEGPKGGIQFFMKKILEGGM